MRSQTRLRPLTAVCVPSEGRSTPSCRPLGHKARLRLATGTGLAPGTGGRAGRARVRVCPITTACAAVTDTTKSP